MGPKRDTVGEMEKAIRKQGLKFMVAFHHAENHWFFPHWKKNCDTSNPEYSGLYGPIHDVDSKINLPWRWIRQAKPSKEYLDNWKAKIIEVLDNYKPDLIWFDFGLGKLPDKYKREMLAYYFNKAEEWGKEVAVTYKMHNLPPNVGILDYERGRAGELTYYKWITDSSVDDQGAWSYVKEAGYKSGDTLIHNLVDRVSKNGYLLLNFGPKANGEIPDPAKNCLLQIGKWLEVNGEAIYNTTPWFIAGEGKTKLARGGGFSESAEVKYTARDIRFTVKDNIIYAIALGWPGEEFKIKTLRKSYKIIRQYEALRYYYVMDESDIRSIKMLGVDKELEWELTDFGLKIKTPNEKPCEHAYVFKISRQN
jgi:alpha-L-fucosidase